TPTALMPRVRSGRTAAGTAVRGAAPSAAGADRLLGALVLAAMAVAVVAVLRGAGQHDSRRGGLGVEMLAARARLRHAVLRRLHLLAHDAAGALQHAHARRGCLDGERTEDS